MALLAFTFLLALSGPAFATDIWTDISDAAWQSVYHVSAADAFTVAAGYEDGTFRPDQPVTHGQFAKMVTGGLHIPLMDPSLPTFSDVPRGSIFYRYIEGAIAAGVISGYPDGTFRPDDDVLRQQTSTILGRWLSQEEIAALGGIQGVSAFYPTLATWFAAEGEPLLSRFADRLQAAPVHQPATAYLVMRGVVLGSSSGGAAYLRPLNGLTRAQAVAMILRTRSVVFHALPTITSLNPAMGPTAGGTSVLITGTGFGDATLVTFGDVTVTATVTSDSEIMATAPAHAAGPVEVRVTGPGGRSRAVVYTYADSSTKAITAFSFRGLSPAVIGAINEGAGTIALTVPSGTDVTALVATFTTTGASVTVGGKTQVSGVTANNFSGPVSYTVTAADASTRGYLVTVTV
jgi:hypothetical protein